VGTAVYALTYRHRDVADSAALFAGGQPQPDEQARLAGAGITQQRDWFARVHVASGGEVAQVAGAMPSVEPR
jgi:hypothetical protein